MKISEFIFRQKSFVFTIFFFLILIGVLEYFLMPREEDPRLRERVGVLKMIYPGASLEDVRRLVVFPTEDALADVPEIKTLEVQIRPEVMIAQITLFDSINTNSEIAEAWKRIEDAISKAQSQYPSGLLPWDLNRRVLEQDAILISVSGNDNLLFLKEQSEALRKSIILLTEVAKVNRYGDPEEDLVITTTKSKLEEKGLSLRFLSNWLTQANHNIPSGTIVLGSKKAVLKTDSYFQSSQAISELSIPLPSGYLTSFGEIGTVALKPHFPPNELVRWNGQMAICLGVVPKQNLNLIQFGKKVEREVEKFQELHPSVKVEFINSQHRYVETRLKELGWNLFSGILIVAAVLVTMMGYRLGILSSLVIPAISLISLGIYGMFGGILHQISIAAFVMALGLLIDNVVVILEGIQEKIDSGMEKVFSVKETISSLAFPLFSATGTTLASFIPLLGSSGNSADFTRSIPIINMLTLTISFFFAIFITPILAQRFLKQNTKKKNPFYERISETIGKQIPQFAKRILITAIVLFLIAMFGFQFIPKKFFPDADRDQLVLDLKLPEGTDISKTNEVAKKIEEILKQESRIKSFASFVGRSTPRFYYNLNQTPNSPHVANILINLKSIREKESVKKDLENRLNSSIPFGVFVLLELKQGPPIKAPVELRFYSSKEDDLFLTNLAVQKSLLKIPGLKKVRSDLSVGTPVISWNLDDASLARYQTTRSEVALSILAETRGIPSGYYHAKEKPIPILIKTGFENNASKESIANISLASTKLGNLGLSQVAANRISFEKSSEFRRNRKTGFNIFAELEDGVTLDKVVSKIEKEIENSKLPKSIVWEFGGERSESGDANQSLVAVAPIGIMILVSFLLVEFKSYKKTFIILLTVPLSMIGIVPGLLLSGKSFGFLSLLGFFALTGIVVNNGILILDYISSKLEEGQSLSEAIQYSISKRIRPILLTTLTTVAGFLPLAFTDATLWPPFAWTMISGLLASTFLTLAVIPSAAYLLLKNDTNSKENPDEKKSSFRKKGKKLLPISLFFSLFLLISSSSFADQNQKTLTWKEVVKLASESPRVKIAFEEWKRKHLEREKLDRAVYYPKLGLQAEYISRDRAIAPNANLPVVQNLFRDYWAGGVEIQQVLFDPANWFAVSKALEYSEDASRLLSIRSIETSQAEALLSFVTIHRIKTKIQNLNELKINLEKRNKELRRFFSLGQINETDKFKIEQAINQIKITLNELGEKEKIATLALKRNLGIDFEFTLGELPAVSEIQQGFDETVVPERLEILALSKKISALLEKKKGIELEALPKLVAKGNYVYLNNNQFNVNQWNQFSVGISVNPFDGGIRKKREEETESEIRSTKEELGDLVRALNLEKEDSKSQVLVKRNEVALRESNLAKVQSAAASELSRVRSGKTNINSWIESEILYSEEKDKFQNSKIELLEKLIRYRNVMGVEYKTQSDEES